jgi:hypothetical protein
VFALHNVPKEKLDKTRQLLSQAGG